MNYRSAFILFITTVCLSSPVLAKSGILDFSGRIIVPVKYSKILPVSKNRFVLFTEELRVHPGGMIPDPEKYWFYEKAAKTALLVDENGKTVGSIKDLGEEAVRLRILNPPLPDGFRVLSKKSDYLYVYDQKAYLHGIFDMSGREVLPAKFSQIYYVGDQMFLVRKLDNASNKEKSFLYRKSKRVAELPNWIIPDGKFKDGKLPFRGNTCGYITMSGKVKLCSQEKLNEIRPRKNNYRKPDKPVSKVLKKSDESGLIPFSVRAKNGSTRLRRLYNWGYRDNGGKVIIEPKFSWAGKFRGDYALVRLNKKFGVINKKGRWVIKPTYESVFIGENRFIVTKPDFKSAIQLWKQRHSPENFCRLLNEHDFIGMSVEQLEQLMGKSKWKNKWCAPRGEIVDFRSYGLGGTCTGSRIVDFGISKNGTILGWRNYWTENVYPRIGPNPPFIRENVGVVLVRKTFSPGNLVPKSKLDEFRKLVMAQ